MGSTLLTPKSTLLDASLLTEIARPQLFGDRHRGIQSMRLQGIISTSRAALWLLRGCSRDVDGEGLVVGPPVKGSCYVSLGLCVAVLRMQIFEQAS